MVSITIGTDKDSERERERKIIKVVERETENNRAIEGGGSV